MGIILETVLEMRNPLLYAMLILLLAVAPIFFIEGQSGVFFQSLIVSYGLAVVASMLVALIVTPALCMILLANAPVDRRESPLVRWLRLRYEWLLTRIIQRPRPMIGIVAVLTVIGLMTLPLLNQSLLPPFKEPNLRISLKSAPGTSQPYMSRITGLISQELRSIPGVRTVGVQVGRAVQGDQIVNVNSAELWVSIDPAANYDKTAAIVKSVLNAYPGIHHDVQTYLQSVSSEVAAQRQNGIVVRVFGDAPDTLRTQAEAVKHAITGINGIVNSRLNLPVQQPTLKIEVDLAAAQHYGIKPGDVRRAAAILLSGVQVGNLFEEQKVFDVVVWSTPETRSSLSSINDLQIDTPDGGRIRLGDVAKVRIAPVDSVIRHEAVKRYIDVTVDVQGRDLGAVAADINGRLRQMQFPLEYHAEVLNNYATPQAAQTRLLALAIAAALVVFFLLQAAFGSWRLAFVTFLTLPSALVGGLLIGIITNSASLGWLAGLSAVFGIALRHQILLINRYHHLARHEGEAFGSALALRGASERVTPTLMTTFATGFALLPALFLGDVPGLEIVRPMALTVLGGLVTSTLLNLFILPALYLRFGSSPAPEIDLSPNVGAAGQGTLGGVSATPVPDTSANH